MTGWMDSLTPDERAWWDQIVYHTRHELAAKIDSSAFVMIPLLKDDEVDVKFALELGLSIMMDKPLLITVQPGATAPRHLRKAADEVVHADLDTEEGRARLKHAIDRVTRGIAPPRRPRRKRGR